MSREFKRHIAVDMDDVILDFMPNVMACFEREYGIVHPFNGSPWGPDAVAFTKHPALLESGYKDWWGWLRDRDWLWGLAPAVPGAIGGLKTLRARGYYVELVTSKPEWAEPQVWKWLGRWRPDLDRVTIVRPGESKAEVSSADGIIDDKIDTVKEWEDLERSSIWFNRGPMKLYTGVSTEANNWADILEVLT
jgi:hypothetical protein